MSRSACDRVLLVASVLCRPYIVSHYTTRNGLYLLCVFVCQIVSVDQFTEKNHQEASWRGGLVKGVQDPVELPEQILPQDVKFKYATSTREINLIADSLLVHIDDHDQEAGAVILGLDGEWQVDARKKAIDVLQLALKLGDGSIQVYVLHLSEIVRRSRRQKAPYQLPVTLKSVLEHKKVCACFD